MSTFLSINYATLASMHSHLGSMTADMAIPSNKSPITNLKGAQSESLKLQSILKENCGKG